MRTVLFSFIILSAVNTYAQRGLMLSSRISGRHKFIPEGTRVIYEYTNRTHPLIATYTRYGTVNRGTMGKGTMLILNDSTIKVNDELINIKDLMLIRARKPAAWIGPTVLMIGGMTIVAAGSHKDADTGQTTTDTGTTITGLALFSIGVIDVISQMPKTTNVWRVEVKH
ncbi:MAG: hypothetical protein JST43_06185 [Bacteroidetes bacterium]|nr:hypothetical protein [Bacteroidota bacterium]MBS1539383.1 hypothetical protein [Bacteroidota bacterium]